MAMIDDNAGFLSVLETLFNESNVVAEIYISLPNASYSAILKTLEKHEEFFKTERVKWQIKSLDLGFEIRFDRTNRDLAKKVI